jgi:hypothetical protein
MLLAEVILLPFRSQLGNLHLQIYPLNYRKHIHYKLFKLKMSLIEPTKLTNRNRITLFDKKQIVQCFYNFAALNNLQTVPITGIIKSFILQHDELGIVNSERYKDSLLRWIRADQNGLFLDWDGCNYLSNKVCCMDGIAEQIDRRLVLQDAISAEFNRIAKSKVCKETFGVFARTFIPAGTFLGCYRGEVITPEDVELSRDLFIYSNLFCANETQIINAQNFISCFARYYQSAPTVSSENVYVRRVTSNDPQSTVCFYTSTDVNEGDELFVPLGCQHLDVVLKTASPCFRRVNKLLTTGLYRNVNTKRNN